MITILRNAGYNVLSAEINAGGASIVFGGDITQAQVDAAYDLIAWYIIRDKRDKLLRATDYAMLPDAPPYTQDEVDALADYRQALRDIPQTFVSAADVVFPDKP